MLSGFLNIYKEKGVSSAKVVGKIKYLLKTEGADCGKIGHFGTLDPQAEGVLPIALGRATRLFDYFTEKEKIYYAEFRFGETTDTLDGEGAVTQSGGRIPDADEITAIIPDLTGTVAQIPPVYSAKSVGGERAYDLARRGLLPDLAPKTVEIKSITLLGARGEGVFAFRIVCGGGTYIRSIARDIGAALGTFAYMSYLRREKSGLFGIENAVKLSYLESTGASANFIPMERVLGVFPRFDVPAQCLRQVMNGQKLPFPNLPDGAFTVYGEEKLIGMGTKTGNMLDIKTRLI